MTLVIFNYKTNKASVYYKLFYIKDGKLIPIGFEGLDTDYNEIAQFKKVLSGQRFVYKSTCYNSYGIPLDILRALQNKFTDYQYIDDWYNGTTYNTIERTLKEYSTYN